MRIMTVRQPWAHAIIHFGKDVENRVRNLAGSYRGPVAIHAARAWDYDFRERRGTRALLRSLLLADFPDVDFGAIIGVVDLVDVHESERCFSRDLAEVHRLYREDHAEFDALPDNGLGGVVGKVRYCSPWAEDHGRTRHLVLANPRPLSEPIPYKGALGLRRLPAEVVSAINADLGTVQA